MEQKLHGCLFLVCCVQVLQQLEQAKHVPDFNNYLSFIFSKGDNLPLEVRPVQLAGQPHSRREALHTSRLSTAQHGAQHSAVQESQQHSATATELSSTGCVMEGSGAGAMQHCRRRVGGVRENGRLCCRNTQWAEQPPI